MATINKAFSLDNLDRKLLYELDLNSRQSLSELSRKLRQGRDRVSYRIERLVDQQVIRGFSTAINPAKIGLSLFKIYARLENNSKRISELVSAIEAHPSTHWIALTQGAWDLMFSMRARTPHEFYHMRRDILSEFQDIVMSFGISISVDVYTFAKDYLVGQTSQPFLVGGPLESVELDDVDHGVLKLLAQNSRFTTKELADRLDTTPAVVSYRIKKLEDTGAIARYRVEIDLGKLHMSSYKAQLDLRSQDVALENKFLEYCTNNPNVTYYIRQLGDFTLEISIIADDQQHYYAIISEMREKFVKLIRSYTTLLVSDQRFHWSLN